MDPDPKRPATAPNASRLDQASLLELASSLAASTSEFAHDANNLVLQVMAAQEIIGDQLESPIATEEEIERLVGYARNVSTIARDLARLVEENSAP